MKSMKIAYGNEVSYGTVIDAGKIERLETRRENLFRRFAEKCVKNPRYKDDWFPENFSVEYNMRKREKYFIPNRKTETFRKSPIIAMRTYLNSM